MAQTAEKLGKVTIAEYDRYVQGLTEAREYELVDGELVLMANPTETHEQIASNIGSSLKPAMDRRGCRTYQGGIRVQASHDSNATDKFRPDVVVRCGPVEGKTYITDPVVVVEVLSPSTLERDRGVKLAFYKSMPTIQHVVLAYSDQMRLEHFRRTETGWEVVVLTTPEDFLQLDAVEFQMDLEQVYFALPF
jgi:Uma2 family endonuclease